MGWFTRKTHAAPEERTPEQTPTWLPGWVFAPGDTAEAYKARLLAELDALSPDMPEARALMEAEIAKAPEADHRHMRSHLVRHLQTFALLPEGPGTLVDIGGPSLHDSALRTLKHWTIETVRILAIDYERDPLPHADGSADAVTLCEVIEHFNYDPIFSLAEINRILKPGGHLLITTPNAGSWFTVYQALRQMPPNRWGVYATPDATNRENHLHAREYLVSEFQNLLPELGFEIETIITRDYGIFPAFAPVSGYPDSDRGETIFCLARKVGAPRKRAVSPIYLEDRDWPA